MNAFENINNVTMNDEAKARMCEELATWLEKQEKRSASRTWGVAFTSKRVKAACAIALSAAIVTAVAVPVGIYYGESSIYYGFQLSDAVNSSIERTPAAYLCAYRLDAKTWDSSKSVPITVYYGIAELAFYYDYGLYNWTSHDKHGDIAKVELYFYIFSSTKTAIEIESPYINLAGMEAGDIDGSYYLHKIESYGDDEWREIFDEYALSIKNEKIHFYHSEQLSIPNEIMPEGSGKLYFDFAGKITYEDGFMCWSYSGLGNSKMISLNYRSDNGKVYFSSPN